MNSKLLKVYSYMFILRFSFLHILLIKLSGISFFFLLLSFLLLSGILSSFLTLINFWILSHRYLAKKVSCLLGLVLKNVGERIGKFFQKCRTNIGK